MTSLEERIQAEKKEKEILIISHAVLGYPNFEKNHEAIDALVNGGVELIELQIPFSDPEADGPFFTSANQSSVASGTEVSDCIDFAKKITEKYPKTCFLFMTYFNIVFKFGVKKFVQKAKEAGVLGIIIPDLPFEEAAEFISTTKEEDIAPIFMATPTTTENRLKKIVKQVEGFLYCQARTGVTGTQTDFNDDTNDYINLCKKHAKVPLAMGFGITKKEDVDFLKGKVDIAICCTKAVKVHVEEGKEALEKFIRELR